MMSQDSSVGSFCHRVQIGSGAHPAFYEMGTGVRTADAWS